MEAGNTTIHEIVGATRPGYPGEKGRVYTSRGGGGGDMGAEKLVAEGEGN